MAFWVAYDHLGRLIVANLAILPPLVLVATSAQMVTAPPTIVLHAVGILAFAAGLGCAAAAAAGMAAMLRTAIETRDTTLAEFVNGVRAFGLRAALLTLGLLTVAAMLVVSVYFYAFRAPEALGIAGFGLAAGALWALLFLALAGQWAIPALVQKRGSIRDALRISILLVLDNPFYSLSVALVGGALAAAAVAPPFLIVFSLAPVMVVQMCAYERLARKYEDNLPPVGGPVFGDGRDDYLNRGIRDLVFPWKI